jgi:hypothetical protein
MTMATTGCANHVFSTTVMVWPVKSVTMRLHTVKRLVQRRNFGIIPQGGSRQVHMDRP